MPVIRISPKRQITIPKPVFDAIRLEIGDFLDASVQNGKIILSPKKVNDKACDRKFSSDEQKILARAKDKINKIKNDVLHSKGLTIKETEIAAKAGLIDEAQRYYWTEEWQKDLRASERDIRAGRLSAPTETAPELMAQLDALKRI